MEELVKSKQFIGGVVVGAITGAYVMYSKLYRHLAEMVLKNTKDKWAKAGDNKEE